MSERGCQAGITVAAAVTIFGSWPDLGAETRPNDFRSSSVTQPARKERPARIPLAWEIAQKIARKRSGVVNRRFDGGSLPSSIMRNSSPERWTRTQAVFGSAPFYAENFLVSLHCRVLRRRYHATMTADEAQSRKSAFAQVCGLKIEEHNRRYYEGGSGRLPLAIANMIGLYQELVDLEASFSFSS